MADRPVSNGGGSFLFGCLLICLTMIFGSQIRIGMVHLSAWLVELQRGIQAWMGS